MGEGLENGSLGPYEDTKLASPGLVLDTAECGDWGTFKVLWGSPIRRSKARAQG